MTIAEPVAFPPHELLYFLPYITPLNNPIPPHLLSDALLQRHQFLQLTPDDASQYLSWPAENTSESTSVAQLLDLLSSSPPDTDVSPIESTQYSYDGDHIYAHVHLKGISWKDSLGLRLVFQWNPRTDAYGGEAAWRYHDARLMPFPAISYDTVESCIEQASLAELREQSDNEDFFSGYSGNIASKGIPVETVENDNENNYWAKYASVEESVVPFEESPGLSQGQGLVFSSKGMQNTGLRSPISILSATSEQDQFTTRSIIKPLEPLEFFSEASLLKLSDAAHRESRSSPQFTAEIEQSDDGGKAKTLYQHSLADALGLDIHGVRYIPEANNGVQEMIKGAFLLWTALLKQSGENISFPERKVEFMKLIDDALQSDSEGI